jgi:hypothetical protein
MPPGEVHIQLMLRSCTFPILSSSGGWDKTGISFGSGGWTDLNQGAGGDYIYLEARSPIPVIFNGTTQIFPVTNIAIISSTSAMSSYSNGPYPWTFVNVDLNKGAGGKWIYICYQNY